MYYSKLSSEDIILDEREIAARLGVPLNTLTGEDNATLIGEHNGTLVGEHNSTLTDEHNTALTGDYDAALKDVRRAAAPAYVAERVRIMREGNALILGKIRVESEALSRASSDCEYAYLMCATLGIEADRLIMRRSGMSVAEGFVIDALSDAMIEGVCDFAERELCGDGYSSIRFSPGYGDLPLSVGREIVSCLNGEKLLGVRFTDSDMMIPKKTVSAIICIKTEKSNG